MEAISIRLEQLEHIETALYSLRQATIQRRSQEDNELQSKRRIEDGDYLQQLADHDREEDNLRLESRLLKRSSIGSSSHSSTNIEIARVNNGPAMSTSSKPVKHRSVGGPSLPPKNCIGRPAAHDSQGRALFTRPSDGKLVYLRCYVPGCERTVFESVQALRRHVSGPSYRHKMKGTFSCNNHAIEICGEVAPGQEGFESGANQQASGIAAIAIMGSARTLTLPSSGSNIHGQGGEGSWGSRSDNMVGFEVDLNTSSAGATERDHGSRCRASSINCDSNISHRKTRAQQAAEIYGGSSSDSEEEDEDQPLARAPASRIDRQVAATEDADGCNPPFHGNELFNKCAVQERSNPGDPFQETTDSTIKEERAPSPSLSVEHHPVSPGPVTLSTPFKAPRYPGLGAKNTYEKQCVSIDTLPNGKRAASSPPSTPLQHRKRTRDADEPSTIRAGPHHQKSAG